MRLFAAIDLTDEARAAIAAARADVVSALGDRARGLKLVRPEHIHLTLAFAGQATEAVGAAIVSRMEPEIAQAPFELAFGGVGTFPSRGAPRVLWLGVMAGAAEAVALQAAVAARFASAGAEQETRPFRPHLTLGRWRSVIRLRGVDQLGSDRPVATVRVAGVTVYQSRVSSSGPTYSRLVHCRLTCP
jgi:2'-5' RNA ligase